MTTTTHEHKLVNLLPQCLIFDLLPTCTWPWISGFRIYLAPMRLPAERTGTLRILIGYISSYMLLEIHESILVTGIN